jgi:methylenetetrahydrofolate dehydrogenase (NADP+) / methenyltetrahydrofolate cyclohydrolase
MAAEILSGREVAASVKEELRGRVNALKQRGVEPCLAAILVGDKPESVVYVSMKERDCDSVGIRSVNHRLAAGCSQEDLLETIRACNEDPGVHGILLQHPISPGLDEPAANRTIATAKDIDGVSPASFGELIVGAPVMVSPTALGAMALLKRSGQAIAGKRAVVVGRSHIVGAPAAWLLVRENATVTICHSRTVGLADIVRQADILIAAVNQPEFITADQVRPGAIVIDCGYNRVPGRKGEVGAVHFPGVSEVAGWISPVPGGVGPAGRAMLIANCVRAAELMNLVRPV